MVGGIGKPVAVTGSLLLFVVVGLGIWVRGRRRHAEQTPIFVKLLGGYAVPVGRHRAITIGGYGANLAVPGVPAGVVLAYLEWCGNRGELELRPGPKVKVLLNGAELETKGICRLGQTVLFVQADGNSHDATIYSASAKEVGLGAGSGPLSQQSALDPGLPDSEGISVGMDQDRTRGDSYI